MGSQRVRPNWATELTDAELSFPDGSVIKNPPVSSGDLRDMDSIPESGRSPGEGNSNSFQSSCLDNSMDKGAWWAIVHMVANRHDWVSTHTHRHTCKTIYDWLGIHISYYGMIIPHFVILLRNYKIYAFQLQLKLENINYIYTLDVYCYIYGYDYSYVYNYT